MKNNKYIQEVDSFRALAVIFVVVFHAFPTLLPGGFIGVDIFFVISGYVVSRAYFFSLLNKQISFVDFFSARLRRLAPAAIVMLFIVSIFAVIFLYPDQLLLYSESLLAQVVYVQNFIFWAEGDYFNGALSKPLLHTWSLAIEEQFYFSFIILIVFFRSRYKVFIAAAIVLVFLLSLLLGFMIENRSPKTVFYMLPTRMWEFMLGAFGWYFVFKFFRMGQIKAQRISIIILPLLVILMIVSAAFFNEEAGFPGAQSILACLSIAISLILTDIYSGHRYLAWLRIRPIVYVGKVSYGFYLWHWPVLVFYFYSTGIVATPLAAILLMAFSFLLAAISYKYLEAPIRLSNLLLSSKNGIIALTIPCVIFITFGIVVNFTNGMVNRYPVEIRPYLIAAQKQSESRCEKIYLLMNPTAQFCPLTSGSDYNAVLILGDSHANAVKTTIKSLGENLDRTIYLTVRNCDLGEFGSREFCSLDTLNSILKQSKELGVNNILAISYWDLNEVSPTSLSNNVSEIIKKGFDVTIMRRVPDDDSYDPKLRAIKYIEGFGLDRAGIASGKYRESNSSIDNALDSLAGKYKDHKVSIISPGDVLCPSSRCIYEVNGSPIYSDSNHLTPDGAALLAPLFRRYFETLH